ncbi:hypothetical protein LguiB_016552 [Lonicera macranthoides]
MAAQNFPRRLVFGNQNDYTTKSLLEKGLDAECEYQRPLYTQFRSRTTDLERSKVLIHVSSEWGVALGTCSPSNSFRDNCAGHFSKNKLRIVNEENTSYKPSRQSGKNYTRRYPSRIITISSLTTSRETHHLESSGTRDLLRCQENSSNREHIVLSEAQLSINYRASNSTSRSYIEEWRKRRRRLVKTLARLQAPRAKTKVEDNE